MAMLHARWRRAADTTGASMLEFVLVLPFIWIVLALSFNFGLALVEKQRALVATREYALRDTMALAGGRRENVAARVTADTLAPRGMSGSYRAEASSGCPDRGGSGAADRGGVIADVSRFLGRVSSTQVYRTSMSGQPLASPLLPKPAYASCFAIDSNPWNYHDNPGGYWGYLRRLVPGLGRIL
jgi:hypothetical protein